MAFFILISRWTGHCQLPDVQQPTDRWLYIRQEVNGCHYERSLLLLILILVAMLGSNLRPSRYNASILTSSEWHGKAGSSALFRNIVCIIHTSENEHCSI